MHADEMLLSVLCELERSAGRASVRFRDGDFFLVRVVSTGHAEAGGDIVAEVLQSATASTGVSFPTGSYMNFLLGDVTEVSVGETVAFSREL